MLLEKSDLKRCEVPGHLNPYLMGCLCRTIDFDVDFKSFCIPHEDKVDVLFDAISHPQIIYICPLN